MTTFRDDLLQALMIGVVANLNQTVLLGGHTLGESSFLLEELLGKLRHIPQPLIPKITRKNPSLITFDNGSRILCGPFSKTEIVRGRLLTMILIDSHRESGDPTVRWNWTRIAQDRLISGPHIFPITGFIDLDMTRTY